MGNFMNLEVCTVCSLESFFQLAKLAFSFTQNTFYRIYAMTCLPLFFAQELNVIQNWKDYWRIIEAVSALLFVNDWKLSWEESPFCVLSNIVLNITKLWKVVFRCTCCVWFLMLYYSCKNGVCVFADTTVFKKCSNALAALTSKLMLLPAIHSAEETR